MNNEKAKGPGYEMLQLREPELLGELIQDYQAGRALRWPVLTKDQVHRIWSDFARDGYVRDERGLDNIYASMRDNAVRLQIATIVSGHEGTSAEAYLEDELEPERHDAFCSWLIDYDGGWRISDYGIRPLYAALALAFEARTPGARLKYLDRALNVTHMRGDLSKLFIAGGRTSVMALEEALGLPEPA